MAFLGECKSIEYNTQVLLVGTGHPGLGIKINIF